ncbi:MAG TPA: PIG-L deacetylase family protein [Actinomycetales bacterium]|nr:PIG-L deacetylase family protein [Actinomycetales bacterium]
MPMPDSEVERVLAVAAHPDDIDFGASGTMATFVDTGIEVTYLICTYGDQGGFDETPREEMPVLREAEQRAAAAAVGVTDVRFLTGYRDGWLEPTFELQRDIVRVIRQVRPRRMLVPSPERWWERIHASHPDHLACGEAAIRAIYPAARNPFAWPELITDEGLEPWTVDETWLMAHPASAHGVDITDVFDRKVAALTAHASQTGRMGDQLATMLAEWGHANAVSVGLSADRMAETFKVVLTA